MGFVKEFKEFAMRGNVMDLAIGIILGGSFGKIVTSLVNDIAMPPIGLIMGGVDFKDLFIDLSRKGYSSLALAREAGAPVIAYGSFLNVLIDFLITALVIFLVIRYMNKLSKLSESGMSSLNKLNVVKSLKGKEALIKENIKCQEDLLKKNIKLKEEEFKKKLTK